QHLRVGDEVRMVVTSNLRGPSGALVVPKDAVAFARVAELELVSKDKAAKLYLIVEKVTWKNGGLPLHAFIIPPLVPTRVFKLDFANTDALFRPDIQLVGIAAHETQGTYLYCRKNFILQE